MCRFMNNRMSALQVLDKALTKKCTFDSVGFTSSALLYEDILCRILVARQSKVILEDDLLYSQLEGQKELSQLLNELLLVNGETLKRLYIQHDEYGPPPHPYLPLSINE